MLKPKSKTKIAHPGISILLSILLAFPWQGVLAAGDKLKDFRASTQKIALLGVASEFVEPTIEDKWTNQVRKLMNRYSRSYGANSIQSFNLATNTGKQFFKPATNLEEAQKKFLQAAGKDNSIDIIALGSLRETGDQFEMELQLFDARIETMSGIEKASFTNATAQAALEQFVYRLMNYLDRDGFVHPQPQDFLEPPTAVKQADQNSELSARPEFSVNPNELGNGNLAGMTTVGGEKTPFWETWWFWSIIGGSLVTAGALTYYFLVIDQPTTKANVNFQAP